MKFGIFFELSTPRPFSTAVEWSVYHNALEQCRLADELGFDHVWAVEHHFLEEYSHCSSPEVFLTAVAAQTKRIRVGHGAVVCVPEMNHPIRVAERAAALDIISNGRLEFGTARSSTWTELGGFSVNPDDTKKTWDEFVRVLPQMWTKDEFEWQGKAFSMPSRNVLPKPYQKPHPPMWVTVTTPGTELDAADRGLGCLGVVGGRLRRAGAPHRGVLPSDRAVRSRRRHGDRREVTTLNFLFCHEDHRHRGQRGHGDGRWLRARELASPVDARGVPRPVRTSRSATSHPAGGRGRPSGGPGDAYGIPEGICVGDPDIIGAAIERWESVGVTGINFLLNALESVPQQQVLDSMRLFARE